MSAKTAEPAVPGEGHRDDIEAKLRELRGEVDSRVEERKVSATVVAVGGRGDGGRRRRTGSAAGATRKRQTVFEIRRI